MILGVSLTKRTTWRGIEEEFSNVYHFQTAVDVTSDQVVDGVLAAEREIFGNNVTFVNAKVWGPTDGTALQSRMLLQRDFANSGNLAVGAITAKELAAVVQWDTGRINLRGGRIFLRKYLHVGRLAASDEEAAKGNAPMQASSITALTAYADDVKNAVGLSGADLCDEKGRLLPFNTPAIVLPHLHTRQFRR
jgi:hypothetical protein